jgi:uncharacterized membrane-anchored protein YhcB (DUF1043 family)
MIAAAITHWLAAAGGGVVGLFVGVVALPRFSSQASRTEQER